MPTDGEGRWKARCVGGQTEAKDRSGGPYRSLRLLLSAACQEEHIPTVPVDLIGLQVRVAPPIQPFINLITQSLRKRMSGTKEMEKCT